MKEKLIVMGLVLVGVAIAAWNHGTPAPEPAEKPVKPTPVSVGPPPDGSLGTVRPSRQCLNCECRPTCDCKEPDECNPPRAVVCACGGDGILDGPYGPLLCPTCVKGKSSQIPTFSPTLYTQPKPIQAAPQTETVWVATYGPFGRQRGGYWVTRQKSAKATTTYYRGGCANGRCGR